MQYEILYTHDTSGLTPSYTFQAGSDAEARRIFRDHVDSGYAEGDTVYTMEEPGAWKLRHYDGPTIATLPEETD